VALALEEKLVLADRFFVHIVRKHFAFQNHFLLGRLHLFWFFLLQFGPFSQSSLQTHAPR